MGYSQKGVLLVVCLLFLTFSIIPSIYAQSATFTNDEQLFFTGSSSSPSTLYQDAIGSNSDVGIQVCDIGQAYVGGFYALYLSGSSTWVSTLITYGDSSNALAFTSTDDGGGCYSMSPGFLTVSPSSLSTPDPDVDKAAFPGKLFIGYDLTGTNPGIAGIDDYIFANTDAQLLGSYSIGRSYDQASGDVTVSTPTITFQTSSGSFSKSSTDASFGISSASGRQLVLGICNDDNGDDCESGQLFSSSSFPTALASGVVSPNDQSTQSKYVVANGLGYNFCIGANLQASISTVSPDPVYYSQVLTLAGSITNPRDTPFESDGGNVDVTTDFTVNVLITNSTGSTFYNEDIAITDLIAPDGSSAWGTTWDTYAKSGTYTLTVTADSDSDISECNEGDNIATTTFEVRAVTLPVVRIDGAETANFSYPNVPYEMGFYFKNSDNDTLSNASVKLIETNGLNVFGPTQFYNMSITNASTTQSGIVSNNTISFVTDFYGNANFTIIPTHNDYYSPQYDVGLTDYVGSYALYMTGFEENGDQFIFISNQLTSSQYNFSITNTSYKGPFSDKSVIYENVVSQILDFVYQSFTHFIEVIVG